MANAFYHFIKKPQIGGKVYNLGGGRDNSCSILEAIEQIEDISGQKSFYEIEKRIELVITYGGLQIIKVSREIIQNGK